MSYQLSRSERAKVDLCQEIEADPKAGAAEKIRAIEKRERIIHRAQQREAKAELAAQTSPASPHDSEWRDERGRWYPADSELEMWQEVARLEGPTSTLAHLLPTEEPHA